MVESRRTHLVPDLPLHGSNHQAHEWSLVGYAPTEDIPGEENHAAGLVVDAVTAVATLPPILAIKAAASVKVLVRSVMSC